MQFIIVAMVMTLHINWGQSLSAIMISVKYRLSAHINHLHPAYQLSAYSLRRFFTELFGEAITDRNHKSAFSLVRRQTGREVRCGLSVGMAKDV